MRPRLAFAALLLLGANSFAQITVTPNTVTESDARQHLLNSEEPQYPPIAKAARIQGDVLIRVEIDVTGRVVSETFVSGPAMLRQAAFDAVKSWQFTPFKVDGIVTQTTTTLTIPFHIDKPGEGPTAEQEKAAQAWFSLSDKCRNALKGQNLQDSLDSCKEALDMSLKAGDLNSSDQLARVESHQLYGHALLADKKPQEALEQENLAIQEAKKCLKETDQEFAMPFYWRAIAEVNLGQVDASLADLNFSEETLRRAIIHLPEMKNNYGQYLASILKQHAGLLDQLGRPADAAKLRAEAGAL